MTKFNYPKDKKKNYEKRASFEHKVHLIIGLRLKTKRKKENLMAIEYNVNVTTPKNGEEMDLDMLIPLHCTAFHL